VRAHVLLGNDERARDALEQLRAIASRAGTPPLKASVLASQATLAEADGDHDGARRSLEDAIDLLAASDAPFETASLRLDLAAALRAVGRNEAAGRELDAALAEFRRLGAAHKSARAESMLRGAPVADGPLGALSRREREVLGLVAEGLTNQEIAARLVLSRHTVNRHVANILRKLGLPSRVAAASLAVRAGLE
jgi:LuxR family maltose regulon positive regulatory protein